MCQPRKWWQGIVPLIFLWLLTIWFNTTGVEHELAKRGAINLANVRLHQPKLEFQGRDALVLGQGFSEPDQKAAVAAIEGVIGVRLVHDATSLVEESRPYGFSARREGNALVLTGTLPDPAVKEQLHVRLQEILLSAKLDDQTRWARGAPERFLPYALFGLMQLTKLGAGEMQLSGSELTLAGVAPTRASYDQVRDALKEVPEGLSLVRVEIAPPIADPFVWRAMRDRNRLTLAGNVPSASARDVLEETVRRSLPQAELTDEMEEARGAGPAFSTLAATAIEMLGRMTQGRVSLVGDRVSIDGDAATSQDYAALIGALEKLPGGSLRQEATVRPPRTSLYRFEAVGTDQGLRLEGYVPSPPARAALLATASRLEPWATIDDQLLYAAGEPDGFVAASQWGLEQLARLIEGRLTISGIGIALSGTAADSETRQAVEQAMAGVPQGFLLLNTKLSAAEPAPAVQALPAPAAPALPAPALSPIIPPAVPPVAVPPAASVAPAPSEPLPLPVAPPAASIAPAPVVALTPINPTVTLPLADFQAQRGDGKLTLTGVYPDERAHEEIIDAAHRAFFAEAILDRMTRSDKASRPLAQATLAALGALARLEGGSVTIKDMKVRLDGEALYERAVDQIRAELRNNLPAPYQVETAIAVKVPTPIASAGACQRLFSALVAHGKILFDSGRASLSRDSIGLLDFIVHAALRCPQVAIEVDGHTDSDGNPDANLDLSKRRAQSVVEYLAKAGIDPAKLTAVGFGNSRPIADNSNEEGKAENRRIEFVVR